LETLNSLFNIFNFSHIFFKNLLGVGFHARNYRIASGICRFEFNVKKRIFGKKFLGIKNVVRQYVSDEPFGCTLLHSISKNNGCVELLQFLIDQGVDVHATNWIGYTALDMAIFYRNKPHQEILKRAMAAQADK